MALNRTMGGLHPGLDVERQFRRLCGTTLAFEHAPDAFRDIIRPSSHLPAVDLQTTYGPAIDAFALGKYSLGVGRNDLHRSFAELVGMRAFERASLHGPSWEGLFASGRAFESFRAIKEAIASLGIHDGLARQIREVECFDRRLCGLLPPEFREPWSSHLKSMALSAAAFLSEEWGQPTGLFSTLGVASLGASFAWLAERREEAPLLAMAAMVESGSVDERQRVDIEVEVVCAFCGEQMIEEHSTFRWVGRRRGVKRVNVIPLCKRCVEQAQGDPAFWHRSLDEIRKPKFRIIDGGYDGPRRAGSPGHLHMVRMTEDEEGDEDR